MMYLNILFGSQIEIMTLQPLKMNVVILKPKLKKLHNLPHEKAGNF